MDTHQNIFQMYLANGCKVGFWVKRNSWSSNIARITLVDGKTDGPLVGNPPYFNNPKARSDVYMEHSGQMRWAMGGSGKNQEVRSPNTYAYTLVPTPTWWKEPA